MNEERALDLFLFCEGLVSKQFKVKWLKGVIDKEDLVQDLYLHFHAKDTPDPPKWLVLKVARDKVVDLLRREGRKRPIADPGALPSGLRTVSSTLNAREEFNLFREQLTEAEREIFAALGKLHRWDRVYEGEYGETEASGLTKETAVGTIFFNKPSESIVGQLSGILGISPAAVSQRLSRIRKKYFIFRDAILSKRAEI